MTFAFGSAISVLLTVQAIVPLAGVQLVGCLTELSCVLHGLCVHCLKRSDYGNRVYMQREYYYDT